MYTRQMRTPPENIIEDGKPVFGTFNAPFKILDISGLKRPFGDIPFPSFITNLRIRASLSFTFVQDDYIGIVDIFDARMFGSAEVSIWNTKNGKKHVYRKITGPRRRLIPKNLEKAKCISLSSSRYIRISWNRLQNRFSVVLGMKGHTPYPSILAYFSLDLESKNFAQIASVCPSPISRRCSAMYQLTAPLTGNLNISEKTETEPTGLGYFTIKRAYYHLRTKSDAVMGLGFIEGKQVSFRLSSSTADSVDDDTYNENVLFVNGETISLPPITITRPDGVLGRWVIQDTENMVDLSFFPITDNCRKISAFILRAEIHSVFGTFEGFLATAEGEALFLKEFNGIGKKNRIRM